MVAGDYCCIMTSLPANWDAIAAAEVVVVMMSMNWNGQKPEDEVVGVSAVVEAVAEGAAVSKRRVDGDAWEAVGERCWWPLRTAEALRREAAAASRGSHGTWGCWRFREWWLNGTME